MQCFRMQSWRFNEWRQWLPTSIWVRASQFLEDPVGFGNVKFVFCVYKMAKNGAGHFSSDLIYETSRALRITITRI